MENSRELHQAEAFIWSRTFNILDSMSLRCAIQLGIPDAIHNHGKPISLAQLIAVLPIHLTKTPFVERLMRILVHRGFFGLEEEGYVLTDASKLLLKDSPSSLAPFVLGILDPFMIKPSQCLGAWLQNDDPTPFHTAYGMAFYEKMEHDTELTRLFNDCMANDSLLIANVLTNKCYADVFEGLETFVDVGGGTGSVTKAIAATFPNIECTCFDLPHVVADLQGSPNLKFVGGNMFDAVPHANAILLKSILHNWNDEQSLKILERCREAITIKDNKKKGKVIIIDIVIGKNGFGDEDDDHNYKSIHTQLLYDMQMMVFFASKERNENEWSKLFFDAGFRSYKISHIFGLRSLIEVYP